MINAGAILVCSLLKTLVNHEMTLAEKFDYTQSWFQRMAGGENFGFNNSIFLSEREAADRNYALGFYMREHKVFPEKTNLRECLDFYFQVRRNSIESIGRSHYHDLANWILSSLDLLNGDLCRLDECCCRDPRQRRHLPNYRGENLPPRGCARCAFAHALMRNV